MAEPPLTGSKTKLVFERLPAPIPAGGCQWLATERYVGVFCLAPLSLIRG